MADETKVIKVKVLSNLLETVDAVAKSTRIVPPGETTEVPVDEFDRLEAAGVVEKVGR